VSKQQQVSNASRLLVLCCLAVNAVYGAYLASIGLLLPQLGRAFTLDTAGQGRIMSAGFAGCVAGVLTCGPLSDRAGRQKVVVGCGALFCIGLTGLATSHTVLAALCAAPLAGAGSAGMQAASGAYSADLLPALKAQVLNLCQVAFAAGAVAGPFATARVLATSSYSWHGVYSGLAASVAAIIGLFVVLGLTQGKRADAQAAQNAQTDAPSSLLRLITVRSFVVLCLAQLFYAGAEVGYFEWMPSYIQYRFPQALALAAECVSLFWFGMTLGRMAMAPLLLRFRPLPLGAVLALSGACAAGITPFVSASVYLGLCVLLVGLFFGGVYSSILVETGHRFSNSLGTAIGGIAAASSCGTTTIPWAVGKAAASTAGWHAGLLFIPASAAVASAALFGMHLKSRQMPAR
jgi:fucose permease